VARRNWAAPATPLAREEVGGGRGVHLLSVCGRSVGRGVSGELDRRPRQARPLDPLLRRASGRGKEKGRSGRSIAALGRAQRVSRDCGRDQEGLRRRQRSRRTRRRACTRDRGVAGFYS
jgi:hypothetical protein